MLQGHVWTIRRHVMDRVHRVQLPPSSPFEVAVDDDRFGSVALSGRITDVENASGIVVLVHGLGGSSQSSYLNRAHLLAVGLGLSVLRLDLRGADGLGADIHHAGLGSDLGAVLASKPLQRYTRRYLLGYSIGGHVCLKYAADCPSGSTSAPNALTAVAAICPPLHLEAGAAHFDAQPYFPYRRHVLQGLIRMYGSFVERHGPWPVSTERAQSIRRIREFDEAIIAPRFGFKDAGEYYHSESAAHVLHRISVPTLIVATVDDPMVPKASVRPLYPSMPSSITLIESERGGHVAFPADLSLGQLAPSGLESQVLHWLTRQGRSKQRHSENRHDASGAQRA